MTPDALAQALIDWRLNKAYLSKVVPLIQKRVKKLDDVIPLVEFLFSGDLDYTAVAGEMRIPDVAPADASKAVLELVEKLEAREAFTAAILEEETTKWYTALTWQKNHALSLLRLMVTARKASPPMFETMEVLGKEVTRRRLRRAAELIAKAPGAPARPEK
jgi:glutamyl-tRNA synthetase